MSFASKAKGPSEGQLSTAGRSVELRFSMPVLLPSAPLLGVEPRILLALWV